MSATGQKRCPTQPPMLELPVAGDRQHSVLALKFAYVDFMPTYFRASP